MGSSVNQFSALIFGLPAVLFVAALLLRDKRSLLRLGLVGMLLVGSAGIFLLLRPGGHALPPAEVAVLVAGGGQTPVLLEIYSQY